MVGKLGIGVVGSNDLSGWAGCAYSYSRLLYIYTVVME